jgi:hypothetical protein
MENIMKKIVSIILLVIIGQQIHATWHCPQDDGSNLVFQNKKDAIAHCPIDYWGSDYI